MGDVVSVITSTIDLATGVLSNPGDFGFVVGTYFDFANNVLKDASDTVTHNVNTFSGAVVDLSQGRVTHFYNSVTNEIVGYYDVSTRTVTDPFGTIKGYVDPETNEFFPITDAVGATVAATKAALSPIINDARNVLIDRVQFARDLIIDEILDALDNSTFGLGGIIDDVKDVIDNVWNAVQNIDSLAVDIFNEIDTYLSEIYEFIIDLPSMIIGFLVDVIQLVQSLTTAATNALSTALSAMGNIVTRVASSAVHNADRVISSAMTVYESSMRALGRIIQVALDSINIALESIGEQANALLSFFLREFRTFGETALKRAAAVSEGLASELLQVRIALSGVTFGGTVLVFTGKNLLES